MESDRFKRNRFPKPEIEEPTGKLSLADLYPIAGLVGLASYLFFG
jgi:hypothetical protein